MHTAIFAPEISNRLVSFIEKLKKRWQVTSAVQVILILIVFACTGCSIIPIKHFLGINAESSTTVRVLFYIGVFPIYNILLLCYGFLFGQYRFFINFEKRFFNRILNLFAKRKKQ
ncbi:MAG: DUF6787 family protein [Bacteroidota bacterium]